ncbi:uncharacterized protein TNCV_5064881 [Trichonephila clavipes]|nr:uncharacterized protein TNCV_5064881 [Trichonephila clavipes]
MADGIGSFPSSSYSEGDTFRSVSWCSLFKISWSSSVVSSSSCPIMRFYVILVHLQFQISRSCQNFIHNFRDVSLITSEYVFVVQTQKLFLESVRYPKICVRCPITKNFLESVR